MIENANHREEWTQDDTGDFFTEVSEACQLPLLLVVSTNTPMVLVSDPPLCFHEHKTPLASEVAQ